MDWHEGFQIYGEHGSAVGKIFNPWYYKSSEVELFSERTPRIAVSWGLMATSTAASSRDLQT